MHECINFVQLTKYDDIVIILVKLEIVAPGENFCPFLPFAPIGVNVQLIIVGYCNADR